MDFAYIQVKSERPYINVYPCVLSFDQSYAANLPYYPSSKSRDTTFQPSPGWFDNDQQYSPPATLNQSYVPPFLIKNGVTYIPQQVKNASDDRWKLGLTPLNNGHLNETQYFPWQVVFNQNAVGGVGAHPQGAALSAVPPQPANETAPGNSGFLGSTPTNYYRWNASHYVAADYYQAVPAGTDADGYMYALLSNTTALNE